MNVTVNRWTGCGFARPEVVCVVCSKPATVVTMGKSGGSGVGIDVCDTCLDRARREIAGAVLRYHRGRCNKPEE